MWLTREQAAELIGITTATFDDYRRKKKGVDGPLPAPVKFKGYRKSFYDAKAVVDWHVANEIAKRIDEGGSTGGDTPDYKEERARLTKAQRERQEQMIAKEAERLVPVDDVQSVVGDRFEACKAHLRALPPKIGAVVPPDARTAVENQARNVVDQSLVELSQLTEFGGHDEEEADNLPVNHD